MNVKPYFLREMIKKIYCSCSLRVSTPFAYQNIQKPALMAHLDACPTGDQEVAGLTLARLATFCHGD